MSAPWKATFQSLKDDGSNKVLITSKRYEVYDGTYEGVCSWYSQDETLSFEGIVVTDEHGIMSWIPYEQIKGVELL